MIADCLLIDKLNQHSEISRRLNPHSAIRPQQWVEYLHAFIRIRVPRVRETIRVSDPRRAVAELPGLPGRRSAQAAVGFRGTVEHAGEVVQVAAVGAVRILRRPARTGGLHQLRIRTQE